MRWASRRDVVGVATLAVGYYLLALPGLGLTPSEAAGTPLWPSAGLALAVLLRGGLRLWPGVALGTVAADLTLDVSPVALVVYAAAASIGAAVGVQATRLGMRHTGPPDLGRSRDVLSVLLGGAVSASVSACVALPGIALDATSWEAAYQGLARWWTGDLSGALVTALLVLSVTRPPWPRPRPGRVVEAGALAVLLLAGGLATESVPSFVPYPIAGLMAWAAVRFRPLGGPVVTAAVGIGAAWAYDLGSGPLMGHDVTEAFALLNVYLLLFGVGPVALHALYRERAVAADELTEYAAELSRANDELAATNRDLERRGAELERAYSDLARTEERFRLAFDNAPIGVALTTPDGRCLKVNGAFGRLVGRAEDSITDRLVDQLCHPDDRAVVVASRDELIATPGVPRQWDLRFLRPDGTAVVATVHGAVERDHAGTVRHLIYLVEDVSEQREAARQLQHMAFHDPLTELPNRALLKDRLELALRKLVRKPGLLAVLFSDLDRFKVINDTLGHDTGDRLIQAVASRMQAALRPGDTVARFGGDEFVVLAEALPDEHAVHELADRLHAALRQPFHIGDRQLSVGASIGIALGSGPHQRPEELLQNADAAMYLAKSRGTRTALFGDEMRTTLTRRFELESGLRDAVENGALELHYQPQIALDGGRVDGVEALLRWRDPRWQTLPIPEVIAVAEETGLIVPIGAWAVREACRQLVRWDADAPRGRLRTVAVNLSPLQLARVDLLEVVSRALEESGVEPQRLCVEITETALLLDVDTSVSTLESLRRLGVRIALDDFGTGYSSLSYLKRLPIDVLKIDRSFVAALGTDSPDAAIVDAVVSMAQRLGMTTVGEGVESSVQFRALVETGSDHAQGFHLSRPVEAGRVVDLIDRIEERSVRLIGEAHRGQPAAGPAGRGTQRGTGTSGVPGPAG